MWYNELLPALKAQGLSANEALLAVDPSLARQANLGSSQSLRHLPLTDALRVCVMASMLGAVEDLSRWLKSERRKAVRSVIERSLRAHGWGDVATRAFFTGMCEGARPDRPESVDTRVLFHLVETHPEYDAVFMASETGLQQLLLTEAVRSGDWSLVVRLVRSADSMDQTVLWLAFVEGFDGVWTKPPKVLDHTLMSLVRAGMPWSQISSVKVLDGVTVEDLIPFGEHLGVLYEQGVIALTADDVSRVEQASALWWLLKSAARTRDSDVVIAAVRKLNTMYTDVDDRHVWSIAGSLNMMVGINALLGFPDDVLGSLLLWTTGPEAACLIETLPGSRMLDVWLSAVSALAKPKLGPIATSRVLLTFANLGDPEVCRRVGAATQEHPWVTCMGLRSGTAELREAILAEVVVASGGLDSVDAVQLVQLVQSSHAAQPVTAQELGTVIKLLRS